MRSQPIRYLAALSLAVLLAGCTASGRPHAPVHPATPASGGAALDERALLLMLVDRQAYDDFTVQRALAGDAALREELAVALGRIPERRGRSVLTGLLLDDAVEVRRAAAFGLGELEDPEAKDVLLKATADPDREVGSLAVEALGKLGVPVLEVAERLLPLPEAERSARLFPYLFRFKEDAAVRLAERGLALPDPQIHAWAAYALGREPRPAGLAALRGLTGDPDPFVRTWVARAFGLVGEAEDLVRLRALLDDPAPGPVSRALAAARALIASGKAPAPADWAPKLAALLTDPRPGVAQAALEAAGAWPAGENPTLAAALLNRFERGEPWERAAALAALAAGRNPKAAETIAAASGSDDAALRAKAAEAAGLLGLPVGKAALEKLTADPQARVRAAAVAAWLEADPEAVEVARKALTDPDPGVRATALGWLGEHPRLPADELGKALDGLLAAGAEEWGQGALQALVARWERESAERPAIGGFLTKVANSGPYVLRREAAAALNKLGLPAPSLEPAMQTGDLARYRDILQRTAQSRTVEIRTSRGAVRLRLECPRAPLTCLNFLQLAEQGYFDGQTFHRVVPDFVVQGGDPRGDGSGGPGYSIRDEINRLRYVRGAVGMALSGPDTGGSQFFFTLTPQPHLDGGYTVFGTVTAGMEVVDTLRIGDRIEKVVAAPAPAGGK